MKSPLLQKPIFYLCILTSLSLIALWGCGSGGGTSSTPPTGGTAAPNVATVTTTNASVPIGFSFTSPVTVKSGASVTWVNQSSAPHSIVWDSQTPSTSPAPGAGISTFAAGSTSAAWIAPTVTINTTYAYHCGIHGPMMAGQIIVTP